MSLARLSLGCFLALIAGVGAFGLPAGQATSDPSPSRISASITVDAAWVRQPPPVANVAGAYVRLVNPSRMDDRLLAARTPLAERVEIHAMHMDAGVMRMRALDDGLSLPAGSTVTLAPGGLHLMLIGPTKALVVGKMVPITLIFERAPEQTVEFEVRPLVEDQDGHPGDHSRHHHGGH